MRRRLRAPSSFAGYGDGMDASNKSRIDTDTDALLALTLAGGPAAPRRALLETHGSAAAVRALPRQRWRDAGLETPQIRALEGDPDALAPALLARCRDWLQAPGHRLIGWQDVDYPPLLRRMSSPPLALFVAGDAGLLWHPAVAVVGSRSPTVGGRDNARSFTCALAAAGFGITSGLAAGVDRAAHEAALGVGGVTVAVLGTGPDVPYPQSHAALLARVAGAGAVVSEHPPGTDARREHFPSRNRIIAGLALGTLVVEAAQRSGALITARHAGDAGREVFAIPGSIHNPMAHGCHRLIRQGAALVESAEEAIAALGPVAAELAEALRARLGEESGGRSRVSGEGDAVCAGAATNCDTEPHVSDSRFQQVLAAIGHDPVVLDQLAERTGLTVAALSSMLVVMEMEGLVRAEHGRYTRRA